MLAALDVVRAQDERVTLDRRRFTRPVLNAATVALALSTVLLALLFVALVLVAAAEGSTVEGARATNVVSAVGEALLGSALPDQPAPEPSARVCWFSRSCR